MSIYRINKNKKGGRMFSDVETAVSVLLDKIGNDPDSVYVLTEDSELTGYFDIILAEYDPRPAGVSSFIGRGGGLEIMSPYSVIIKLCARLIKLESIVTVNGRYCISFHLPPFVKNAVGVDGFYWLLETFAFMTLGVMGPSYSSDGIHYDHHFDIGDPVPQWVVNLAAA